MPLSADQITRDLGQLMLNEINLYLQRNAAERTKLLAAAERLAELDASDAVLIVERNRLMARAAALTTAIQGTP